MAVEGKIRQGGICEQVTDMSLLSNFNLPVILLLLMVFALPVI